MELVLGDSIGVLHGDTAAEFRMGPYGFAKVRVGSKPDFIEGLEVEINEALPLGLADAQPAVHTN